ncbi:MAG: sugar transferase [Bacteroidaceae bacterium]|nr:sugar transferase [Bacteroidaceae bacterium]MBR3907551.1 sugar transferase [Bacteroidaceae bacterium]
MNAFERAIKRFFDIICSFLGLVILSPVFLIVYIMLRIQRDGSVIFSQERIGYKGKPFRIYKFRTMRVDSERDGEPQLASKGDERLTKVGRFLREHHLDELPQLFNVLKGDMSFVGPRPERQYFIDKIRKENPDYDYVFLMRPGLTSMATIHNGYTDTMEKMLIRLDMDLEYLRKRSLWLDAKLIFTTFLYMVNGKKF